jgi:Cu/Ag efflux protein CusF
MLSNRFLIAGLLPLALGACMQAGPANANAFASVSPVGIDLGRSDQPMAGQVKLAPYAAPVAASPEKYNARGAAPIVIAQAEQGLAQAVGTVNSVDPTARSINISHGPIRKLGWPPMTMDFPVAPSVDLTSVKPGEKIRFMLKKGRDDTQIVQSITVMTGQ